MTPRKARFDMAKAWLLRFKRAASAMLIGRLSDGREAVDHC
ncbi:hypothetical protein [Prevotella sp.]